MYSSLVLYDSRRLYTSPDGYYTVYDIESQEHRENDRHPETRDAYASNTPKASVSGAVESADLSVDRTLENNNH